MQNFTGLIWLLIPFVMMILVMLLFLRPQKEGSNSKKGFYVIIVIGSVFVIAYFIWRLFISP